MTVANNLITWYAQGLGGCHLDTLPIPDGKRFHHISFVYLHGELEQQAGFDLICVLTENGQEPAIRAGKYPVSIAIRNRQYPSMAFIWTPENYPELKGLVVLLDDTEAIAHAEAKYAARAQRI
tara:strand:- start:2171 stop:2539 length:369 start_codon:yes stop_codon:yes gene_type:complete